MTDYELVIKEVYPDYVAYTTPPTEVHVLVYRADDPEYLKGEPVARVRFSYSLWKEMWH